MTEDQIQEAMKNYQAMIDYYHERMSILVKNLLEKKNATIIEPLEKEMD